MIHPIKPNFRIPKDYQQFFYLEEKGRDFKMIVVVDKDGIRIGNRGKPTKKGHSRGLDWIAESMEFVRQDCARILRKRKKGTP